jgi:uncharacterized membrane protein
MSTGTSLARGLGFMSLGLGLFALLEPHRFARLVGVRPTAEGLTTARLVGVRELGAAGGLLANSRPAPWPWFRVAGDVMDVALLSRAMTSRQARRERVAMALTATAGITALDVLAGLVLGNEVGPKGTATTTATGSRRIRRSVTVNVPRQQAYDTWRDFSGLPRFMRHLEEVRVIDDTRSHWRAKGPAGVSAEWDAEIVDDTPGEVIAWRSVDGSQIANSGRVRFVDAPADRGTEVHVELDYDPPLGAVGATLAQLFGEEPSQQVADDLRRFKQIVETGRVVWSDATIADRRVRQRPAQPSGESMRPPTADATNGSARDAVSGPLRRPTGQQRQSSLRRQTRRQPAPTQA